MRFFEKTPRWYLSFDGNTLTIITPRFAFVVAHEGYHPAMHTIWNGFAWHWGKRLANRQRFPHHKEVAFAYYLTVF